MDGQRLDLEYTVKSSQKNMQRTSRSNRENQNLQAKNPHIKILKDLLYYFFRYIITRI